MNNAGKYLISFDTSKLPSFITDVLVIGSGVAGLRAAIEAVKSHSVIIVTKGSISESNTYYAQGGIAAHIDKPSLVGSHIDDTIANAYGLADHSIVRQIITKGVSLVNELVSWGLELDKKDGKVDMAREGGHKLSRIIHSGGDATGKRLQETLLRKINLSHITALEHTFVIDLLICGGRTKECCGVLAYNQKANQVFVVWSKKTIIASGGIGQLYRETTNPEIATGDGLSMAYRKSAVLQDLEFVQFHPTAFYVAGASRFLISEAVRGEGGILRDKYGKRFMDEYHPQKELAPRDVVSRTILNQMKITQDANVYLDLRHLPVNRIKERFPYLAELCRNFNIDIAKDLIPVKPSAHYLIGGIKINLSGHTNIRNLFAAGECASVSFHGANRLGSNSLLEALVIGYFAGQKASSEISSSKPLLPAHIIYKRPYLKKPKSSQVKMDLADIKNSLRSLMWYSVGLERDATGLKYALSKIHYWSGYCLSQEFNNPAGWEIQNMLTLARLITESALKRTESRGAHYRTDYPATLPKWEKHSLVQV